MRVKVKNYLIGRSYYSEELLKDFFQRNIEKIRKAYTYPERYLNSFTGEWITLVVFKDGDVKKIYLNWINLENQKSFS